MAYYAKLENDIVQTVIVVSDDIDDGDAWCTETFGGVWVQTFDDDPNKTYAGLFYTYDYATQDFTAPQPFASWSLDANNDWQAPTPRPDGDCYWNEEELAWVAI